MARRSSTPRCRPRLGYRAARWRRHLFRDQRPELLERSPGTEGFCRLLGLVAGRDRQCPEVQPGRAFVGNLVGRMAQADVVADLALDLVGDERAGDTGIDPDYAFFAVEQRKVFVEIVA